MIGRIVCWLIGHHYNTYLIDEVDGELWVTKKLCERCGCVKNEDYHRLYMMKMELQK